MPDNIPSSFRIVENKNRNQKQKLPSNRSNVNKTEESRKGTFVNQDNVHNPGSHVLTMPDNMPSTFRKAEDNIRNQKQKSPSNRSNVDKTELRKEKFVNQDNIHNPGSYVLTMPDNIPSSFRIVEKKNRNQKQKFPSNRYNFNKTEESRKGTFVNQDNIYNPISYLSNMPDKVLSSFRGAENKSGNQEKKFPCNISNNMPKSSNKKSVNDGKVPNSNNFLLITMHEKCPSLIKRTETENQISPCSLSEDNQIKKAVNNDKIPEKDTLKLTMSDKLPSSLKKAEEVNKLENQVSPYSIYNDNKEEKSSKEKSMNDSGIQEPDTYRLTMPHKRPSPFRKTELEKQIFPCKVTDDMRKSMSEEAVNDDRMKGSNSFVLNKNDQLPSSFKVAEEENPITEKSSNERSVNAERTQKSDSNVLTMPENLLSSLRKTEKENKCEKQIFSSSKYISKISDYFGESKKVELVNDDRAQSSNADVLSVTDGFNPFGKTEIEIKLEKQQELYKKSAEKFKKNIPMKKFQEDLGIQASSGENVSNVGKAVDLTSSSKHVFSDGNSVKDNKLNEKSSGSTFMDKTTEFPPRRISVMENSKNNNEKLKSSENKNLDMPNSLCDKVVENAESICSLEKVSLAKPSVGQTTSSKSGIDSSSDKKRGLFTPQNVDLQTKDKHKGVPEESETLLNSENCVQGQIQESGRLSVDQNELEQAVAFLTHNAGGESQESVTPPSQNNSNFSSESCVTAPKDFASLWTQMSELFSPTESQTETPSTSRSKAERLMVLMNQMKGFALGDVVQQLEKQKGS
ncbi:hypothetical protein TNCV_3324831 [Trichonephila clavipes]|nr:hypothetical protein TNCV_3324831 [Trichonephila clavipes]